MTRTPASSPFGRFASQLAASWAFLPFSLLACALTAGLAWLTWGFRYAPSAIIATGVLLGVPFMLLGPSFRSRNWGFLLCLGVAALLVLGNPAKLALLHAPLSIADLHALPVLFTTMSGPRLALGVALLTIAVVLPLLALRLQRIMLLHLALVAGYVMLLPPLAMVSEPLLARVLPNHAEEHGMSNGEIPWIGMPQEPTAILKARGPLLYLASDWLVLRQEQRVPSQADIAALQLQPWQASKQPLARNIHVVLLESIWDTQLLAHHHASRNPLDPRFLALWEQAGKPYALSPVMGGNTANAEFEVLCGFPAPKAEVAFINRLRNASPCLPAILAGKGYRAVASHAHQARNWNRDHAYKAVGFTQYRPIDAFELDDMDGSYLTDSSFFRQNLEYLATLQGDAPVFNYLVSLSSHWAYARDHQSRPDLVQVTPNDSTMLNDYVNAVAWTTHAFMDWTEAILTRDPDAIILAFGDHAPALAGNHPGTDIYQDVNQTGPSAFDSIEARTLVGLSRTPFLLIDGERGAVRIGSDIPLFQFPQQLSRLLGTGELLPQSAQADKATIRPFLGQLLTIVDGKWHACPTSPPLPDTSPCAPAIAQLALLRTLREDTIRGKGHFIHAMQAEPPTAMADNGMSIEKSHPACEFDVEQWGPQHGLLGRGFNLQPDGSSAVWVELRKMRGMPELRVGDIPGDMIHDQHRIIASFTNPMLMTASAPLPVTLQCPGQPAVLLGHIALTPNGLSPAPPAPISAAPPAPMPGPAPAAIAQAAPMPSAPEPCAFEIRQWGPSKGTAGRGFNVQKDGSSAVWISMKSMQGKPIVRVDKTTGQSIHAPELIVTTFTDPALHARAGHRQVSIQCPGGPEVAVGEIEITGQP